MAKNYTIQFKSLRAGTTYVVAIGGGTGTPVPLMGGAQPFTTQESDDEDMFCPIRTQSGYLRIIDNGKDANGSAFDWKDLIPATDTSRPVTLTANGTVVWQGFMQAQNFSGVMYGGTQEREFPVQGVLNILAASDFNPGAGIINFAQIIKNIFDGISVGNFYFQNANAVDWLKKMLDTSCMGDEDTDTHTYSPKYSKQEVLEDFCKFFGYTCRQQGSDILFLSPCDTSNTYVKIAQQNIQNDGTFTYTTATRTTTPLTPKFVSMENSETVMRGVRNVTVNASINKEDVITDTAYSQVYKAYEMNTVQQIHYNGNLYNFYLMHSENEGVAGVWTFVGYDIMLYVMDSPLGPSSTERAHYNIDEWYDGDIADKHNYSFSERILISSALGNEVTGYKFRMQSRRSHNYFDGMFVISSKVMSYALSPNNDHRTTSPIETTLLCKLGIGGKWWNGSTWGTTPTLFAIPVKDGSIVTNRVLDSDYRDYEGHGIPISTAMGGIVDFQIWGIGTSRSGHRIDLEITDLETHFVTKRGSRVSDDRTINTYKATNSVSFTKNVDVDINFASNDENDYGTGIIMEPSGAYCSGIVFSGSTPEHPEQHYASMIAAHGASTKKKLSIDVDSSVNDIDAKDLCSYSGTYFPSSINHDYWDDISTITLLEI